jgi:hypothetical protein
VAYVVVETVDESTAYVTIVGAMVVVAMVDSTRGVAVR